MTISKNSNYNHDDNNHFHNDNDNDIDIHICNYVRTYGSLFSLGKSWEWHGKTSDNYMRNMGRLSWPELCLQNPRTCFQLISVKRLLYIRMHRLESKWPLAGQFWYWSPFQNFRMSAMFCKNHPIISIIFYNDMYEQSPKIFPPDTLATPGFWMFLGRATPLPEM